ncbi:hypothetical protein BC830DRAFT_1092875 [Chytriomyces sp. MP71]|nr:hypothetical protein BC830DRAFT_1092875 [Chytriomyces sp. MP71]
MERAVLLTCQPVAVAAGSGNGGSGGIGGSGTGSGGGSGRITCVCSGRGSLFVGHSDGRVSIATHALSTVFEWRAHEASLSLLQCLAASNVLLSVGEDSAGVPFLRIWNLDKIDRATRCPLLVRNITIQHNNRVFPVTALAVLETLSQIAVGLENGVVLHIRGDIANPDRMVKPRQLWEGSQLITGLGFKEDARVGTVLYITTPSGIYMCNTSNASNSKDVTTRLGEHGAEIGCAILTPPGDLCPAMVLARTEGIYFYDVNGRGSCFMIDGEKTLITWFKRYLVVASRPTSHSADNTSHRAKSFPPTSTTPVAGLLSKAAALSIERSDVGSGDDEAEYGGGGGGGGAPVPGSMLTVYDLRSKCIAFQGNFEARGDVGGKGARFPGVSGSHGIVSMASEWDELFVVTSDQKMYKLEEKDMSTRLDILFSKNMYTLALAMVSAPANSVLPLPTTRTPSSRNLLDLTSSFIGDTASLDPETKTLLIEIHKRYADHLYGRGDYDGAMTQYLYTLGELEPSYVIRKYLDAQRIHLLVQFLQALHLQPQGGGALLATRDHTTLLINCYTKLQAAHRLDEFLRRADVQFDVENAIRVCRAAGFYEHALYLAERFGVHEWYLHIQVEDLGRHAETVEYIMGLAPAVMEACLRRYGHVLVKEMVKEMIDVLVVLCTTLRAADDESSGAVAGGAGVGSAEDEDSMTQSAMGHLAVGGMVVVDKKRDGGVSGISGDTVGPEETKIPYPEDFIHLFVDMDEWCVLFLERVLEIRWGISLAASGQREGAGSYPRSQLASDDRESKSLLTICNTLLEMYLNLAATAAISSASSGQIVVPAETHLAKALHVLQHSQTLYDLDHALILCQLNNFQQGIMYLYERMHMFKEIIEHYMSREDYAGVLESCFKFGTDDPSMWHKALCYFADQTTNPNAAPCDHEFSHILDEIDTRNLMSPLQVIQILSQNPGITMGHARKYLIKKMEAEKKHANESAKLVHSFQEETNKMKALIHELKSSPVIFQSSKCSLCGESLELPSIHFMCKHSYHMKCISSSEGEDLAGPGEKECPICAPEHKMVASMFKSQIENAGQHQVFLKKLENNKEDQFAVIADYFGKNLFVSKTYKN